MYFLDKLCRICVRSGVALVDIDTVDFDSVTLNEKLQICANLAISGDHISDSICEKCVNKLRVSYHFLDMCQKSTTIIQGYLEKLRGVEEESCELNVEVDKLCEVESEKEVVEFRALRRKKQRITKGQRCSLLQQLLNRPRKERDKVSYVTNNNNNNSTFDHNKGGLKSIIDFTKNYEFNNDSLVKLDSTPLDKLMAFSTNYFRRDFSEFKNNILCIIEECTPFNSDEELSCEEEEDQFEEIMVEPDIKIKSELMDFEEEEDTSQCPLDYLETSIEEETDSAKIKIENLHEEDRSHNSFKPSIWVKEELAKLRKCDGVPTVASSPAVKLLDKLVASYPLSTKKVFSPSNTRCRTKDQPYINPMLKNQFLYRSFKCDRCNRYFKSQGYLKAHCSKVH